MATLFEDLKDLIDLVAPADSAALRTLLENPANQKFAQELKDGRLRQADYSRFMNENKGKLESVDKWKTWVDENVPKHQKLVDDFTSVETKNRELETQLTDYREQLAKISSGEMNVDEATLNARVEARTKELGYVNRSELDTIVKQEAQRLAREESVTAVKEQTDRFLTQTWPAAQAINTAVIQKSFQHMKEFGEPLSDDDLKAISGVMTERGISDPRKAYDEWIEPKRREKSIDAEVTRRLAEERSKAGFPGVSGPPISELGPMQLKQAGQIPELPEGSVLGDNAAAMAAAKEFRTEGKY